MTLYLGMTSKHNTIKGKLISWTYLKSKHSDL